MATNRPHSRSRFANVCLLVPALACGAAAASGGDEAAPAFGAAQGVGAKYGAHDPRTCPDAKRPASGPPSPTQAAAYVICTREVESGSDPNTHLYLAENVRVTAVSNARRYNRNEDFNVPSIDAAAPVYDIRGSYTYYQCAPLTTPHNLQVGFADNRGTNCSASDRPHASGSCYKDTFGDWHCDLSDMQGTNARDNVAPPQAP